MKLTFDKVLVPSKGVVAIIVGEDGRFGASLAALDKASSGAVRAAMITAKFTGKAGTALDLVQPRGGSLDRLVLIGAGKISAANEHDWVKLGGAAYSRLSSMGDSVVLILEPEGVAVTAAQAADVALGARLASYVFDRYKTKKKDGESGDKLSKLSIQVEGHLAARKAFARRDAVADGVDLARTLVNTAPNHLGPPEFAKRCEELRDVGVEVEVLDDKAMSKLGMGALLGVGQGSVRGSRLVIMRWKGAGGQPLAFVGKGVTFDTGGISIKPAQGMEDMKGDMAGAACVTGLMHTLAARKARVDVVGIVGLVENMPDGNAQRPGDVVTSMSGQTIEIINTDAEGRLVLADALWYCQQRFKPKFMIDLATLTGAVMVALGQENAGLFSNNDDLSAEITAAGKATGEKVWRLPLSPEYDKMMDSTVADMKNSGGRYAGAITAAQFLQRFVNDVPWAHLDIAGTGMGAKANDINKSWGPGFGVRLLDRLVADHYEA